MYNFSSIELTEGEISLLSLGPKFVPSTLVPIEQTKIDILRFSRKILLKENFNNKTVLDDSVIKPVSDYIPKKVSSGTVKSVIEDLEVFANELNSLETLPLKDNLTVDQRQAFNKFKQRKEVIYKKCDKGSAVCILNKDFYKVRILEVLNCSSKYEMLNRNTDYFIISNLKNKFCTKYRNMLTKKEVSAIVDFNYKTTNIYGLPKIHKSSIIKQAIQNIESNYLWLTNPVDLKFRLIFGGPQSPTSGLQELINELLKPFVTKVDSRVVDVLDFINRIPKFDPRDLPFIELISVDVKSMYDNLDKNLGLPALEYFLDRYSKLLPSRFSKEFVLDAMKFILENNTGYFNGTFYKQIIGTATGIKPAPPYADIAMGYLEINLFYKLRSEISNEVALYFWKYYRRYLDDGMLFWDKRLGNFDQVFEIMNIMHPTINFTMERSDSRLVYLDIEIYKADSCIETVAYNKETDSGSYLPFSSNHPRHCKSNIPFSLARRIKTLTDDPKLVESKLNDLTVRLRTSGYPAGLVKSAVARAMSLSTVDLRHHRRTADEGDSIAFVHTYDPSRPSLMKGIGEITSRLRLTGECKNIFRDTRIIDSRREPLNLLRHFQHSKFDDSGLVDCSAGVTKCGIAKCKLCDEIMECDSVFFRNAGFTYKIKDRMDCTARHVIYALFCGNCGDYYIGETVCLRSRMNTHRNKSKYFEAAEMEVSRHLYSCGHGFKVCPIFKLQDKCKISRLVHEDSLTKLLKPGLNADRRNLLHLQVR